MKTTDLFVEQVLIGLLVLLAPGLAFLAGVRSFLAHNQELTKQLISGALLVAAAYLVGIVYDRVADTLLEDIEQHNRIRYVRRHEDRPDDFPETKYRMVVYRTGGASTYAAYLRSRMRLSRALASIL